jgi:FkbM family methyltransferase
MNSASRLFRRCSKGLKVLGNRRYRKALYHHVAPTIEHQRVLSRYKPLTVVDVGANKGQFSLLAAEIFPAARIYSFEPLRGPGDEFRRLFDSEERVRFFPAAIGPVANSMPMHVARREDSSSLLPITAQQVSFSPGTDEVSTELVEVAPLKAFLSAEDIRRPALLKVDVQGFEREVLEGCEPFLELFDVLYVECSFLELYAGQALATEIVEMLLARKFELRGTYNLSYSPEGIAIQADFLFERGAGSLSCGPSPVAHRKE